MVLAQKQSAHSHVLQNIDVYNTHGTWIPPTAGI